ncbi:MAG: NAD(P)-dependent glycerol-3-phosphate dehydrogenase [Candidatus Omnitrophica bacterium]|nr:NAD(P)-dependent glycerol-3-phosphate dehydrogenase [Candidatus Omnitrophota bacterium]
MNKVCILGDGGWGTALAIRLSEKGVDVSLWGVFEDYIRSISETRQNTKFLKGIAIPAEVNITPSLKPALSGAGIVILAIPSKYLRDILPRLKGVLADASILVSAAKGIEGRTLMRMSELIEDVLGKDRKIAAISGPSIAIEVAKGMPATIVASSRSLNLAREVQNVLAGDKLRVYSSDDLTGVELGGALKNIIAIAAGISDSLGFGANTKAAILTRGLAEITRLGVAMGARRETFAGLSGMGDLITTCISPHSRNRWFGEMLGRGKRAKAIVEETEMVVEGVTTTESAYRLSQKIGVDMPITREIYNVIYKDKSPKDVVKDLMMRSPKIEHL